MFKLVFNVWYCKSNSFISKTTGKNPLVFEYWYGKKAYMLFRVICVLHFRGILLLGFAKCVCTSGEKAEIMCAHFSFVDIYLGVYVMGLYGIFKFFALYVPNAQHASTKSEFPRFARFL